MTINRYIYIFRDTTHVFLLSKIKKYCLYNRLLIFFSGKNCELRTSYCESSDDVKNDPPACKNGGTCVSGDTTYACNCTPGFTGNYLP